jgi:murein DD-endopeptidase MepM/ murein hydrolase activator NlpD
MRRGPWIVVALAFVMLAIATGSGSAAMSAGAGGWTWPVVGPVIQAFDPPDTPYGSGHRGIDIAAEVGTTIVAPAMGP